MASDPQSWADLQAAVGRWLDQDVSAAQIAEFVALAERHFNRAVFTPDRECAFAILADAQAHALPADFWGFKSPPYVDGARPRPLERVTGAALRRDHAGRGAGIPAYFAIEGENILFAPVPTSSAIKGTYHATIPALGASQATNWLLTDHPDLYLAAALAEAFAFHMDEARMTFWAARRNEKIEAVNAAGRRRGENSGPLVASAGVASVGNIQA